MTFDKQVTPNWEERGHEWAFLHLLFGPGEKKKYTSKAEWIARCNKCDYGLSALTLIGAKRSLKKYHPACVMATKELERVLGLTL